MKRKTISLLLTLVMVLALIPGSAAPVYADSVTSYTSGAAAGTAGTPITYAISTEAQLRDLASSVNASPGAISYENTTFLLQNDITLTSN